jgi:hypothetical protein
MRSERIKQTLNDLPDVGSCEKEDITRAMTDEAEFSSSWIHDSILRRYIKNTGDERLNADTRKLIKAKSYDDYINLSKRIHRTLQEKARALLLEIQNK